MPKVGKKEYPYTPKGRAAAKNAEKRSGLKIKKPAAGSVSVKPWGKSYEKFDPDGPEYDEETADELKRLNPLTLAKPNQPPEDPSKNATVAQEGAHEAWVWHPEEWDWARHGSSRDPRTGQALKGSDYTTFPLYLKGEAEAGYAVYKDPKTGKYFSHPSGGAKARQLGKRGFSLVSPPTEKPSTTENKGKAEKRSGLKIPKKKRANKTPKE